MKKASVILCCIFILTLFAGCASDNKTENKNTDDKIAVKVDDNIKVDVGDIKVN